MRGGSLVGDSQGEDPGVGQARFERGRDGGGVGLRGPDDDRRPGARERDAGRARHRVVAQLREQRRVLDAVGLVQLVVEGGREQVRVAGGDGGAEQRGLGARRGGVGVRDGRGQAAARRLGVHARVGHDDDRRQRQIGREPARVRQPGAVAPAQADAAEDRGREVVGVALERQAERQHLVGRGVAPGDREAGDEPGTRSWPRTSRARARAGCG